MTRPCQNAALTGLLLFGAIALIGLTDIVVSAIDVRRIHFAPFQLPTLESGGIAGLALVGIGVVLVSVHVNRIDAARERAETELMLDETSAVLQSLRAKRLGERRGHQ